MTERPGSWRDTLDPLNGKARVALLNEVIVMITIATAVSPSVTLMVLQAGLGECLTHSHMQPGITVLRTESKVALCAHWN